MQKPMEEYCLLALLSLLSIFVCLFSIFVCLFVFKPGFSV